MAATVRAELGAAPTVVALSGGADSAVLAWAAAKTGGPVRAVFVDHGLPQSAMLGQAADEVARAVGISLDVEDGVVESGSSLEGRLRDARYAALTKNARDGELVATGHTSDDQAETVLGNLLRGAGTTGLSGIPRRRQRWVRPLLGFRRSDVRAMAVELGLPFADDPDNDSPEVRRNVIRHDVLPGLAAQFNPRLVESLTETAALLAEDDVALDALAAMVPIRHEGGAVLLPAPVLATVPAAVAARAVRAALRAVHPPYPGSAADVATVLSVAAAEVAAGEVSGGHRVTREGPMVAIFMPAPDERLADPQPLSVPGVVDVGPWRIEARMTAHEPRRPGRTRWQTDVEPLGAFEVRGAETGDRIDIGSGSKPVMEALAERDVAPRLRRGWPVVTSSGRIVWLAGIRRATWARPVSDPSVVLTAGRYDDDRTGPPGSRRLPRGGM